MGGLGSGYAGGRKLCVEECFSLNVDRLRAHGAIPRWGTWQATAGAWGWTAETGERLASVGYEVRAIDDEFLFLTLRYWAHGDPVEQGIWLDATPAHFGGHRWWFMCPLWVRGVPCWRHVGRLYLPPGGKYFGCRHCYGLTYKSAQQAHAFDGLYALVLQARRTP